MSDDVEKLSSHEVPDKFAEWLLAMGCPAEHVPSLDAAKQMCRGQYYIVWRSLMEEVEPRDIIMKKKLTVFADDMQNVYNKNTFSEHKNNLIKPDELMLWQEQNDLKSKVIEAEKGFRQGTVELNHLIDKVSSKLSNRNIKIRYTKDGERRVSFLQKLLRNLQAKKADLEETKNIANSLSYIEKNVELEGKLEKCLSLLRQHNRSSNSILSTGNPVACSSMASTHSEIENEDTIASMVKCRGDALWPQLYEKRAGLCVELTQACSLKPINSTEKITPKSALAYTEALHCTIALEAMKNKAHVRQTGKLLATAITQLNDYMNSDACEYLVLNCERTRALSRVNTLKELLEDIISREGIFQCSVRHSGDKIGTRRQISNVDKAILSKKEELKIILQSLAVTERKILNVKQGLETVFSCLQSGVRVNEMDKFKGQISLPQESIAIMKQFYEERRTSVKKMELSLDLDISANNSFVDCTDNANPTFINELRMYLDKFSLEKNRKLVLENGEKIWISETLQSTLERIHTTWLTEELCTSLLCPSLSLEKNLVKLSNEIMQSNVMEAFLHRFDFIDMGNCVIDVSSKTAEENETVDKMKKILNENIISLQRINRNLDIGLEDIEFWESNSMKQHISSRRTIDGKSYRDYEIVYMRSLTL